jgi:hypothetical protein
VEIGEANPNRDELGDQRHHVGDDQVAGAEPAVAAALGLVLVAVTVLSGGRYCRNESMP